MSSRLLLALIPVAAADLSLAADENWPSFRGTRAQGIAEGYPTPITWDVGTGLNLEWAAPIPGLCHSSPVVWGDRVFVTTAVRLEGESELKVGLYGSPTPAGEEGVHRFQVHCLDKRTGETIWVRTAIETTPKYQRHPKGSHAASSPATDGKRVVASFATEGLFAYDMDGELLWSRDLGDLDSGWYVAPGAQFGFASSPVLHDDRVILQVDVQEDSSLWALDANDGTDVWRTPRTEVPTWGTPTIDTEDGRSQIVVNGYKHMGGYDLETGRELWKLAGGGDVPVPTPIVHDGRVFITNGHGRWNPIYAIDANARGTLPEDFSADGESLLWCQRRQGTYMQTPILYQGLLFACTDAGIVTCIDPKTGEHLERQRLGSGASGFTASPVAADGKLYFTSEEGEIHVIEASASMDSLAVNEMGETCMATPAISEGVLYIRTRSQLVAVAGNEVAPEGLAQSAEPDAGRVAESEAVEAAADGESAVPEDLPEARTLFARHLELRGGREALEGPETVDVSGSFTMPSIGLEGELDIQYGRGQRFHSTVDMGAMGLTRQGFDGETGWVVSPQVGVQVLEGAELAQMKKEAHWLADAEYESLYPEMETIGREDFEGFDCYVVQLQAVDGARSKAYFDVKSGLSRGLDSIAATAGGPLRVLTVYRAYGDYGDLKIATETDLFMPEHDIRQKMIVESVEFDSLPEEAFDLPSEVAAEVER